MEAKELIGKITKDHVPLIDATLNNIYMEEIQSKLSYAPETQQEYMWKSWLLVHYFTVVKGILSEGETQGTDADFRNLFTSPTAKRFATVN